MVPPARGWLSVTMSIRRMTLGSGYRYLMSSVARGDAGRQTSSPLTAYYAEAGTPPGRFLGRGLAGLDAGRGIGPGSRVTEEHLWRMLGMLQDPATGAPLGRPPRASSAAYVDGLGRVRKARKTVAGFDLTFSAPKSVSVAWAMADEPTRQRIYAAHVRALEFVIADGERRVFVTRTGRGGVVSEDVRGVVATAFDHWDSRAGDPQLHTHVVVLNRVQAVSDGGWRSLDSKALFRAAVGMSELYNGVLADLLTAELGVGWSPQTRRRSPVEKWEITGVEEGLRSEFSQRTTDIEAAKDVLVAQFVTGHGRQPSAREVLQVRQQATLATRPDKHVRPLAELLQGWRDRVRPFVGEDPAAWVAGLAGRNDLPLLHAGDLAEEILADAARATLRVVSGKRATFTRANLYAEALRQIAGVRFAAPAERVAVADRVADLAVDASVRLTPPEVGIVPDALRRADGSSMFRPRDSELFTTAELMAAEERLLAAGRGVDGPAVDAVVVRQVVAEPLPHSGLQLSADQGEAVCRVVASGRVVDVIVGPAGTGKSTAMAGVRTAWEAQFGPGSVVGLAPSAAAAEVLAESVGVPTENTTKWLTEAARTGERRRELESLSARLNRASPSQATRVLLQRARVLAAEVDRWSLRPGQLVIVDEASMAGTFELDSLTVHAQTAGAKVLLVGDWAQLSPVSAGGAFKLLAADRADCPQLHDVRRFRHEWERDASLGLRDGRVTAAQQYVTQGRVEGGDRESMLDLLFEAWQADIRAGRRSLMIAADAHTVAGLNARARAERVAAGQVSADGVTVDNGVTLGVGDLVVTRQNHRELPASGGWVKNGDEWIVTAIRQDGALSVRRPSGGATALLPTQYVSEHVELAYATTAHRAQGRTVDTAHSFVSPTTVREPLYVMATRGRESNKLYVDTMYDPDVTTSHEEAPACQAVDVLQQVLENAGADESAHEAQEREVARQQSPARKEAEGDALLARAREMRREPPPSARPNFAGDGRTLTI